MGLICIFENNFVKKGAQTKQGSKIKTDDLQNYDVKDLTASSRLS